MSPAEEFWRWFRAHEDELLGFEDNPDPEPLFDRLAEALTRVHPDLTFEIGPEEEDGRRELVLSAGGVQRAFPVVMALVDAAPGLARWRITPFRPRRDDRGVLELGGMSVDPDEVRFAAVPDGERLGLTVYIPGFQETEGSLYEQAGYLLLDDAVGEFDVETKLGFIEFAPLPAGGAPGLRPLSELPAVVDAWQVN